MSKFALLLHHTPDRYTNLAEDQFMNIMKDYIAWVEKASEDGVYVGGEKLSASEGMELVSNDNGDVIHESPLAELPEILGGMMIVEAPSMEDAVELAKKHPHLVHNSRIEIRLVEGE